MKDTSPEIENILAEYLRDVPVWRKLEMMVELRDMAITIARNAVGQQHPDASDVSFPADVPIGLITRRKLTVFIREFFLKMLVGILFVERRLPGFMFWVGKRRFARQQKARSTSRLQENPAN